MDEILTPGPKWRPADLSSAHQAANQRRAVTSLSSNNQFLAYVLSLGPELTTYPILGFY